MQWFKCANDTCKYNTDLEPPSNSQYIDLIVFLMVWRFWMLFPVLWQVLGSLNISYRVRYIVLYCSWKQIMFFVLHYIICANYVIYSFITRKRKVFVYAFNEWRPTRNKINMCSFHRFLISESTLGVSMLLL